MKTIFITGATDGIGLETARELARQGHELVIHGRTEEKVVQARNKILDVVPGAKVMTAFADLSDLAAVALMVKRLAIHLSKFDVLINNAGVYMQQRQLSSDGYELTFAVNHLAHFALTSLLLPFLQPSPDARVITVSSIAHTRGKIDFQNLNSERHFDAYTAYATSKLANVLFANELARHHPWLCSNSLHPGVIDTKLLHTGFDAQGDTVARGAQTSVYLAISPQVRGVSGKYFVDCREHSAAVEASDASLAAALWDWSYIAVRSYLPV